MRAHDHESAQQVVGHRFYLEGIETWEARHIGPVLRGRRL